MKEIELSAILMNEGKLAREIRKLGVPIEIVDETRMNFFHALRQVQAILVKNHPEILHTHRQKENIPGLPRVEKGTPPDSFDLHAARIGMNRRPG